MAEPVVATLFACLLASGCASSPRPVLTIHDSPRGSVYLEPIPDRSFQATHPITLEVGILTRALRGIQVRDDRNTLQALFASRPEALRVFSDEETDFFAPFISSALAKATPDQRIGFRILQTTSPPDSMKDDAAPGPPEPPQTLAPQGITSGVLFAYGRSLQILLTRFHSGSENRSLIDGANRQYYSDQTGLTGRKFMFFPKEAERPESFRVEETEFPTLVIDYELLAKLPPTGSEPAAASKPSSVELSPAPQRQAPVAQPPVPSVPSQQSAGPGDAELKSLRDELKALQKQVDEQNAELKKLKQAPKNKPPAP